MDGTAEIAPDSMTARHISKPGRDILAVYREIAATYDETFSGPICAHTCVEMLLARLPGGATRVMDAGCGTGLAGPYLHEKKAAHQDVTLVGLDFSRDMLDQAETKRSEAFQELIQRDFNESFELDGGLFDGIFAAGVFLDNHVGPRAIVHIAAHLRSGGFFVISVREKTYNRIGDEYARYIEAADCKVVETKKSDYGIKDSPIGYYIVLQKL